ncbi:MAG: hypothetical protein ACI80V_002604 [Rhodothermales bacterium]|jgi:hypothetical protein
MKHFFSTLLIAAVTVTACDSGSAMDDVADTGSTGSTENLPDVFARFYDNVTVYVDGSNIVLESDGVPDHDSPYFSGTRYEVYDGNNPSFNLNPNRISEQSFTFRIPLNPAEASSKSATPLGAIGVAVNGVAIFNQYAGPNQPLTNEIDSFDQYNGHPQQTGVYHYHVEPLNLTLQNGGDALVGFLLDGFPVYGPVENGQAVTNSDLDTYHGHDGVTTDYPAGIYHYHITSQDPYINGSGFFGAAGTVAQ